MLVPRNVPKASRCTNPRALLDRYAGEKRAAASTATLTANSRTCSCKPSWKWKVSERRPTDSTTKHQTALTQLTDMSMSAVKSADAFVQCAIAWTCVSKASKGFAGNTEEQTCFVVSDPSAMGKSTSDSLILQNLPNPCWTTEVQ